VDPMAPGYRPTYVGINEQQFNVVINCGQSVFNIHKSSSSGSDSCGATGPSFVFS
jgi:hypothetical protein